MRLRPSFVFLIYCGITVVLTYPLILNIGIGAAKRCRRSGAEHLDSLVEHASRSIHTRVVERTGFLSRAGRADLLGKSAGPQPHLDAASLARAWGHKRPTTSCFSSRFP